MKHDIDNKITSKKMKQLGFFRINVRGSQDKCITIINQVKFAKTNNRL